MIVKNVDKRLFLNVTSTAKWDKFCCIVWHVLQSYKEWQEVNAKWDKYYKAWEVL